MSKERNSGQTDADLETLLTRRAELQAELVAVEKQISGLHSQGDRPSAPPVEIGQVTEETKKDVRDIKPAEDLTKLTAEELLDREKTLLEQIDKVESNIRRIDRDIERTQRDIQESLNLKDQRVLTKHTAYLKNVEQEKNTLQDQLSKLQTAYSEIRKAIERNPEAQKIERIAALKNAIEGKRSQITFYQEEKAKQERHLRREPHDEYSKPNPANVRYFKDRIENADGAIAANQEELRKLEKQLAKLE